MRKNVLSLKGFKSNTALRVLAVFIIIALLLTIEGIANAVVKAGNSAGVNMPPVPIFRQTAADLTMIGVGLFLLLLVPVFVVPVVKFAVIGVGFALLGYGLYQVYKLIQGKPVQDLLPKK
jgi:hypothetical protein